MVHLTKLQIRNFKCWENLSLDLKPLTVLIGPNGSGKSSVLQALCLLKRFITTTSSVNHDNLGDFSTSQYLNLGRFDELVYKHEQMSQMRLDIHVSENDKASIYSLSLGKKNCVGELALEQPKSRFKVDFQLPYSLNKTMSVTVGFLNKATKVNRQVIWNGVSASVQAMPSIKTPVPEETVSLLETHLRFLRGVYLIHGRQFFETWTYPYAPSIDYLKLCMTDQELANVLATNSDIEEKVANWTKEILGIEVLAKSLPPGPMLKVESRMRRFRVPLALEGAGLNRLVYILTNLVLPSTKLILVEEPEIHLHPRHLFSLGRKLNDLLREERKQMLITTHNEHILLALLTGIADGSIKREDLAIYYLERDGLSAKAKKLEINEKGQVDGGLPGFFEMEWETTEAYLRALTKGTE